MKTLRFDQFEFDDPSSEQWLEIAISERRNQSCPTVQTFVERVIDTRSGPLPSPRSFSTLTSFGADADFLRRFAGIPVPDACSWTCFVLLDDWNDRHVILDLGYAFISLHWSTSA